jgi:HEAT repeat protein
MQSLQAFLKVQPGEGRVAALLIGLMVSTSAGSALGSTGIEALFFARFGVQFLPYMYVALGAVAILTSFAITAFLGRGARERVYVLLALALGLILVGGRLVLALDLNWFYPVLWLSKEVMNSLIGLLSWGLAGFVCDARQAKRLFPLFGAGRILGAVIGGLGTQPLVQLVHSENLLLVWAGLMIVAFALGRALVGRAGPARAAGPGRRSGRRGAPGQSVADLIREMQRGYQFVRQSRLMQWVSASAVLFSVLYFSLALPFSRAATEQFGDPDRLAGFLGLFQGLSTAAAFFASLFLANRLFARFGIMSAILAFTMIYLAGFSLLAVAAAFPLIVIFRFVQMAWLSGIADSAWQAMFNVIPSERRDQVRAFTSGVPEQAGTLIAGLILVIGESALAPQQLYLVGLTAAVLTTLVIWQAKRAYNGALVSALRAGQPQVFYSEEESFLGFQRDANALAVAVAGVSNPDPLVRRVSAEILGHAPAPQAVDALVNALNDSDAPVRVAALRALARARAAPALLDVAARLHDPEPEVRAQAADALSHLTPYPSGLYAHLRPLMDDPNPDVSAHAAISLLRAGPSPEARNLLRYMAALGELETRVIALDALGEVGDAEAFELVATELADAAAPAPVRRAAAAALACFDQHAGHSMELLVSALGDPDRSVREAAAKALGRFGSPALERATAALSRPELIAGALTALEHLPARSAAPALRACAREQVTQAQHYHALSRGMGMKDSDPVRLLADSLRERAVRHATHALRVVGLLGERGAMALALDNLKSRDPNQRANALETLEAVGQPDIVRPLLKIWENAESAPAPADGLWIVVLQDGDAWLRACAAYAARHHLQPQLQPLLAQLSQSDPDPLVRETAYVTLAALTGEHPMDTAATLSLMDRILFLRRVPLFADLPPSDLKQVAAIAAESFCPNGELFAEQGETGKEMYIIVSGEVRVLTAGGDGATVEVARRRPGEYVGEMALLSQEPRMASLAAAGDVRLLCIDQKSFESLLRERPEISLAVMRVLCARLKELSALARPPA